MSEEEQEWIFTFGQGHANRNRFVRIRGTFESTRAQMFARFGRKWAMQYASEEEAGVKEWNLEELKL